jgi:Cupin domain
MRRKLVSLGLILAVVGFAAFYRTRVAHATPGSGFTSTTLSLGSFGPIKVFNKFSPPTSPLNPKGSWSSRQRTVGQSDLYVQSNVWDVGGTTGWHSHPGHSLITVTAGTVTVYEGDDPSCTPHMYSAGMGFVDSGGDHVHIVRNEGTVQATSITVQLIPSGQPRRIDAPAPGNCPF